MRRTGSAGSEELKPWLVVTPEYGEVIPVLDDGTGPVEYGCDIVFVEAETRQDAILIGVKIMRERGDAYYRHGHADNPWAGVKAELQTCPVHGTAVWNEDHFECPACEGLPPAHDLFPRHEDCDCMSCRPWTT